MPWERIAGDALRLLDDLAAAERREKELMEENEWLRVLLQDQIDLINAHAPYMNELEGVQDARAALEAGNG